MPYPICLFAVLPPAHYLPVWLEKARKTAGGFVVVLILASTLWVLQPSSVRTRWQMWTTEVPHRRPYYAPGIYSCQPGSHHLEEHRHRGCL